MNDSTSSLLDFSNSSIPPIVPSFGTDSDITGELYRCHLCSYSGTSKSHFEAHMNTHFDHKCPFCDYTSRTEGRLKRHIRDFHSEVPPESWAGNRMIKENGENESDESLDVSEKAVNGSGGKTRQQRCKQCSFVANNKQDFWDHSKEHIKSEKLLTCPKCNFVTEYKHHLEYHLRNHFGSKPFKCSKCNYSCVNKSMLNSHMKSHSNIYQYRCADCSYATKYCHSLKLHLRKYQHKPATVLNLDGTPNPYPVIDVYGTRRGPRPKKSRATKDNQTNQKSQSFESPLPHKALISSPLSPNLLSNTPIPPLIPTSMSTGLPFLYQSNPSLLHSGLLGVQAMSHMPKLPNHLNSEDLRIHPLYNSASSDKASNSQDFEDKQSNHSLHSGHKFKCNFCEFSTDSREMFGNHLLLHMSADNQEICKLYDMSTNGEMFNHNGLLSELAARQSSESIRFLEQMTVNPSFFNSLLAMNKHDQVGSLDWHSPQNMVSPMSLPAKANNDTERNHRPGSAPVRPNSKTGVSPPPRSRSSPSERFEASRFETDDSQMEDSSKEVESTPLDLSSNKSTSPISQPSEPKFSILSQHLNQLNQLTESTLLSHIFKQSEEKRDRDQNDANKSLSNALTNKDRQNEEQQTRAQRRKGRASKLIKINDDTMNGSENDSEETTDSVYEEPDVDNIISKINNATTLLQEILIDMYSLKNESYH